MEFREDLSHSCCFYGASLSLCRPALFRLFTMSGSPVLGEPVEDTGNKGGDGTETPTQHHGPSISLGGKRFRQPLCTPCCRPPHQTFPHLAILCRPHGTFIEHADIVVTGAAVRSKNRLTSAKGPRITSGSGEMLLL